MYGSMKGQWTDSDTVIPGMHGQTDRSYSQSGKDRQITLNHSSRTATASPCTAVGKARKTQAVRHCDTGHEWADRQIILSPAKTDHTAQSATAAVQPEACRCESLDRLRQSDHGPVYRSTSH